MLSKPFGIGLLALACVAAAGGGAYLASRQAAPATAAAPIAEPGNELAGSLGPGGASGLTAVTETEALVPRSEQAPAAGSRVEAEPPAARPAATRPRPMAASRPSAPRAEASASAPRDTSVRASEPAPSLERPWPSTTTAAPEPVTESAFDPPPATETTPAVPEKMFEELVVSADSVLGIQMDTAVSSETAKVEDAIEARVTRDVKVGNEVAIPAGSRVLGSVMVVERGGKIKERARLGLRFHTLVLDDGSRVNIQTNTVYREGSSPTGESSAKIGGAAVGGAILGAILGGKKGAVLGGTVGAAGGTAAVMAGGRNAATVASGSTLTVRLEEPVTVTVEK